MAKQSSTALLSGPATASASEARWAQVGVAALFFTNGATVGSWVPHIPDRAHSLGLNPAQLGAVLLAGGLGCVMAMPLTGWLTGRFGSRAVVAVAGPLFPLLLTLAVVAPTIPALTATLVAVGIAGASMDVAMNAHGVLVERRIGRRTISLFHALFSVGGVAGSAATSAALSRHVGSATIAWVVAAVLIATALAARLVLLDDAPAAPAAGSARRQKQPGLPRISLPQALVEKLRWLAPHSRLLLLGVLTFSTMVSEGAVADWSGLLLRVTRGLGDGVVGYGYTSFSAAMVLGRFSGDALVARLGEVNALRLGGLLAVSGFSLMLGSHALPLMLGGFALAGLGLANASPVLYRAAGRLPGVPSGTAIAVAVGVGYAGLLAGPPLLGFVGHAAGLRCIFYVLIGLCLLLAAAASLARSGTRPALSDDHDEPDLGDPVSAEPLL